MDIVDPLQSGQADVYQVKSFATGLDSSRKRQVKSSLKRVASNGSVDMRDWYLAVPCNPTPGDLKWFEELTAPYSFGCHWFGLDRLEALAAKYPDVIDHLLNNGEARLQAAISDLRELVGLVRGDNRLVSLADAQEPLRALHRRLNSEDPFYRYDFEVRSEPPASDEFGDRPGLVASGVEFDGRIAIVHHIYARYRMATQDAPLPLSFSVRVNEMDDEQRAAWDHAITYGTAVDLPTGTVTDLKFGLPGGLGGAASEGALRLGEAFASNARPYRLRLRVVHDDRLIAESVLLMEPATTGILGGRRAHGADSGGAFSIELLLGPSAGEAGTGRFQISVADLAGAQPAALLPGIRLLAALRAPNALQFGPEFGPLPGQRFPIPDAESPITTDLVTLVEALADLQQALSAELRVPNLESLTSGLYEEILEAARLVRGETVERSWSEYMLEMHPTVDLPEGPFQFAVSGSQQFSVGDFELTLDPVTMVLLAAEATASPGSREGAVSLRLRPALGNNTMLVRFAPIEDVQPQAVPPTSN